MFQQTRIRLTIINSLVFITLITILGSIFYSYSYKNLYKDVNHALYEAQKQIKRGGFSPREFRFRDPRTSIIIWDKEGNMIQPDAVQPIFVQHMKTIYPDNVDRMQDFQVEGLYFRSLSTEIDTNIGKITVQVIRITTSEKELLHRLLWMIVICCIIASALAIAAGYFLAERALIPIKKSWERQQRFVSDASHELRTPLTVIQSKTDLLFRDPDATIEEKAMDISTISSESRRLGKLVSNLLALARSDSDQTEINREPFKLDELLHEMAAQYEEIAAFEEKVVTVETSPVLFNGDRAKIHQMLVIFLDNALKFTDPGGHVKLACGSTASTHWISIRDNGIGIKESDIPLIFDRFFQSDASRSANGGAGLGLSIAKWIIEKHHGKIKISSKVGEGTIFDLAFPKHKVK